MFMKFVLIVILVYGVYYGINMLYDIYMGNRNNREEEDVIIDISPSLAGYRPKDANEVIGQESEEGRKDEEEANGDDSDDDDDDKEYVEEKSIDIASLERGDEIEDLDTVNDDEDVAPLNVCGGYTPLEFKKLLQDAFNEPNAFEGLEFASA